MSPVYRINKNINRPLEVKGVKAQYLVWMSAGLVMLLLAFALGYMAGANVYVLTATIPPLALCWITQMYRLSRKYGEHGLSKKIAKQFLPKCLKSRTSKTYSLSGK